MVALIFRILGFLLVYLVDPELQQLLLQNPELPLERRMRGVPLFLVLLQRVFEIFNQVRVARGLAQKKGKRETGNVKKKK